METNTEKNTLEYQECKGADCKKAKAEGMPAEIISYAIAATIVIIGTSYSAKTLANSDQKGYALAVLVLGLAFAGFLVYKAFSLVPKQGVVAVKAAK